MVDPIILNGDCHVTDPAPSLFSFFFCFVPVMEQKTGNKQRRCGLRVIVSKKSKIKKKVHIPDIATFVTT